jgi:hypothetical protein
MKWCYFLRDGHIAGVRMLPSGLPDEDEIAKAHLLFSERKARFDALRFGIAAVWCSATRTEPRALAGPMIFQRG